MSSTDNHSGFRLPWQPSQASAPDAHVAAGTAVAEVPAWPSHDLARRRHSGAGNGAPAQADESATTEDSPMTITDASGVETATSVDGTTSDAAAEPTTGAEAEPTTGADVDPAATSTPDASSEPTDETSSLAATTDPATTVVTPAPSRKPTAFLAELTRAMRLAADEARLSALAQFHGDVERHTEEARTSCGLAAEEARARADADVAELAEWEQREIERIRQEASDGVTARQVGLEDELARQQAHLDAEITRVQGQVAAFEAEMDTFFQSLLREEDPARFAGIAEQLPEPPTFQPWTVAVAGAVATETTTPEATGGADATTEMPASATADGATMETTATGTTADEFAAAEADAAEWASAGERSDDASSAEADVEAGTESAPEATGEAGTEPEAAAAGETSAVPGPTRTQVAVLGLVSVASIASFKRLLARTPGIQSVQVASGPDGEFLFTATHDDSLDMPAAVAAVQGFEVQVVESGPGIVSAQAVDPEVL